MGNYRYAAKDATGRTVEDTIQAVDQGEALAELRRRNLVVLKVEEVAGGRAGAKGSFSLFKARPSASREELVMFTRQLATMVGAGIAILEAIEVLKEQAETPGFKLCCENLAAELRGGSDLSAAMQKMPAVFSQLYISMVCAGEVSGQMDVILQRLAEYMEANEALRREVKSAMTYPVISLTLVLGITAFLMLGVVPTFKEIFSQMDMELPNLTKMVLGTSDFLREHWVIVFGALFACIVGVVVFTRTKSGSYLYDQVSLKVPIFGPLARKIALARFSRTFATLIRSGVPIMGTLDIVADTAGNQVVSNVVRASKESVKGGNMLSEPLSRSKVFPPMVVRMIAIGEKSGALETLLDKVADFYDQQVKAQIKALTSLIEPLLISFMGIIVGGVVMAVFMPLLDIVGKLSSSK
ncbi:MAG: type II secretion system F family protein [Planctomycetota bacterium]|nr:MAG: type II secretion system F family protein [Planctomycetota bacterium]